MKKNSFVYRLSIIALLVALMALLWYGIGSINLGFIKITLSCLPVIIGTMALGLGNGLILAACFGTMSFLSAVTNPQGLVLPIFTAHVLYGAALCYIPRLIVPVVTHAVYRLVKDRKKAFLALPAALGSLTNTVLFLGAIILLYGLIGIRDETLLATIGTVVLVGGLPEAAVAAIVCPPVLYALHKARLIPE